MTEYTHQVCWISNTYYLPAGRAPLSRLEVKEHVLIYYQVRHSLPEWWREISVHGPHFHACHEIHWDPCFVTRVFSCMRHVTAWVFR